MKSPQRGGEVWLVDLGMAAGLEALKCAGQFQDPSVLTECFGIQPAL
jgi:hypothetical protein